LPDHPRHTQACSFQEQDPDELFDALILLGETRILQALDDAWAFPSRPTTLLAAFSSCFSIFHFSFTTNINLFWVYVAKVGEFLKNQYMGRDDTHELYTPLIAMREIILIPLFSFAHPCDP
jgi:hypothetical protein